MGRGAWRATVHRITESDMTAATWHACTGGGSAQRWPLLSTLRPAEFVPPDWLAGPRAVSPVIPPSFLQGAGGADGQGAR